MLHARSTLDGARRDASLGIDEIDPIWDELDETDVDDGVLPRFEAVVRTRPDSVAVADDETELTFAELAARSAGTLVGLRAALADLDPAPVVRGPAEMGAREPVAMCCGHTVDAVSTLLAVLASGHPVLVLDPRTPGPRLITLLEKAGARLLLVDPTNERLAAELGVVPVPLRDVQDADAELLWVDPPEPTSVAALAFTSGSTGIPKPVANDHRLLVRDAWNSSIGSGCYSSRDVIAHTLPIAFHAGLTTTVHGLVVGATMRLYDARVRGIAELPVFIAEHGCTMMITSPAIMRGFVGCGPDRVQLASLRQVTTAGEASYGRDVEALRSVLPPGCTVRNRYGSSETGLIAEYVVTPDHPPLEGPLPAGRGVGRTVLIPVDAEGRPAPAGEVGRLTVTAPQVALGYWGLPEATAAVFRDNADGTRTYLTSDLGRVTMAGVEIVGRADHSVKIRGYLVDPGEVDAVLHTVEGVRETVVVSQPRPTDGRARLVAYVAPMDASALGAEPVALPDPGTEAEWRQSLRSRLPAHMVPEAFALVPALPRNDRGKIDRSALPELPVQGSSAKRNSSWEQLVADQWAAVLEHDGPIEPESDFFALGGDSLAAEALMSRMITELGISGDVARTSTLAGAPTLATFSAAMRADQPEPDRALVSLVAGPECQEPPVFLVAGAGGIGLALRPIALRLGGRCAYALQDPALESRTVPSLTLRRLARRHLRTVRRLQPEGPYLLAGHSFGGLLAFEMAHQLRAQGQEVRLAILDSFPPDPALQPPAWEGTTPLDRGRSMVRLLRASFRDTSGGTDSWRFFVHADNMARRYRSEPWDGEALVMIAQSPEKEARSAWGPHLTGPVTTAEIAGDHFTMLREPWAEEVADHLRSFFGIEAAITARTGATPRR